MSFEQSVAEECVDFALFFGVNPHYLLAVAKKRSNLQDGTSGNLYGPFRLSQAEWDAHRVDPEFEFNFSTEQITSWRRTCDVFALMTYRTQNELLKTHTSYPSAVELYAAQWPEEKTPDMTQSLQAALDATAALIGPAAQTLDDPAESGSAVASASVPINPMQSQNAPLASSFGTGPFKIKAPKVMRALMTDFALTPIQAAGIVGNLGHESGGFRIYHEAGLPFERGGVGWAQWTGPRRVNYENYCRQNNYDPTSDAGNYAFLKHELATAFSNVITSLKTKTTLNDAVTIFEQLYERAGVIAMNRRIQYATIAFDAYNQQGQTA